MKRIFFVLGVLGIMGITASFSSNTDQVAPSDNDGRCEGGSRVCNVNPRNNFG